MTPEGAAAEAAAALVRAKYDLDRRRRSQGRHVVHPAAFVDVVLAFANTQQRSRSGTLEFIPSGLVVGATWNERWIPTPTGDEARALCDRLDSDVRNRTESWPLLYQVGSLPLCFADEGKNRVEMYQQLGRPLLGEARQSGHPDASELVVSRGLEVDAVARAAVPEALLPARIPRAGC